MQGYLVNFFYYFPKSRIVDKQLLCLAQADAKNCATSKVRDIIEMHVSTWRDWSALHWRGPQCPKRKCAKIAVCLIQKRSIT